MIHIRPALAKDVEELYGEKNAKTLRAMSIYNDDELAAVAGLIIDEKSCTAFCKIKDRSARNKITIWRCAREIIRNLISTTKAPVYALADPEISNSGRFLERLGFTRVGEDKGINIYLLDKNKWE